ncbi:GNAT family N-acetyltransferase [Entomobacter blattae]|uniref:Acetyltransferase (GNAT) domain protein n=1 Tax=Entomobacter blattae TaxID=2762277 RepID=A0A7H1NRP6_9PROT|nr:GNAT family N-acetyltransferase [Entomobacter blattae]QNT78456.1 Acetyltransferase (GNAT) domain protein [Entomobacter blattae]
MRPVPLSPHHDLEDFNSGDLSLDEWLRRKALKNQVTGALRTFVYLESNRVKGYYALASGALDQAGAPGSIRRNMPDPIPVAVLARLAVDSSLQGQGLGASLLKDVVLRLTEAAEIVGIRGILVHAVSDRAKSFYKKYGFIDTIGDPYRLVFSLKQKRQT